MARVSALAMKDLIKADILEKYGVTVPKSAIKVECPE